MILNEFYTLSSGTRIPKIGLGTWMLTDAEAENAVKAAAALGYRMFDTAQAYGNEAGVGRGVKTCGVKRDELFVATKVAAEHKDYRSAAESIDRSLVLAKLDYFDQIIIHCPQPWAEFRGEKRYFEENKEVWRALEDAKKAGKVREIGVSNFLTDDLDSLLSDCKERPAVNQFLAHITNTPFDLLDYCKEKGIQSEAYSPIAHGEALKNPEIAKMAQRYGISVPALCVRYVLNLGMIALPKTGNPAHMQANAAVDFDLAAEDFEALKHLSPIRNYGEANVFPCFSKGIRHE